MGYYSRWRVGGGPLHHAVFAARSPSRAPLAGGSMSTRKAPRWVIPFVRALARTGVAREAAKDAGIDHTTAYERRKAHADFAADWAAALRMHAILKAEEEREAVAAIRAKRNSAGALTPLAPPPCSAWPPSPANAEAEMVISGGQM